MQQDKNNQDSDIYPENVTLRDFEDFDTLRKYIFDGVKDEIINAFPKSYGGVRLEVSDVDYADPDNYSVTEQKKALMRNQYLSRRLRGNLKLYDENTGELLDEKKLTLMKVPYLTERGTFIHNGSEYTTLTQARLLPGIYARRKKTGELESHFNISRGTGKSFRIHLEPETALFKLGIGQSNLRLYSLLKDIGISDEYLEEIWGKDILEANKAKYDPRVFDKAYTQLVGRKGKPGASREEKVQAIKDAISNAKVDKTVLERTLPNLFDYKKVAEEK